MNDYIYPIKIKKWPQSILFDEYHVFASNKFHSLSHLNFVGDYSFTINSITSETGSGVSRGCSIVVHKTRLETDLEMKKRVSEEEAYMEEYNKRNKEKPRHKLVKKI